MNDRIDDAVLLAKQRWAAAHPFDLETEVWERLFSQFVAGDILQAITLSRQTRSPLPPIIFQRFEETLARLAEKRATGSY